MRNIIFIKVMYQNPEIEMSIDFGKKDVVHANSRCWGLIDMQKFE